jgi:membrane-bound lytic murein transglycosylase B
VVTESLLSLDTAVIVIDLPLVDSDGQPGRAYRVGTVNFSAILHYNRSYFYAAAVTEYAAALRERMVAGQ